MLSAWRKFTRKQDDKPLFPAGVIPVDQTMQKKFAKGVQYNCKFIYIHILLLLNLLIFL